MKHAAVVCLLTGLLTAVVVSGQAQNPQTSPYRPTRPIAIVGGLLIDATGAAPRLDQTVIIEGERITWVGPMEQATIPPNAEVIDAAGMTIMPGLINSNQHMQLNPIYPSPTGSLPLAAIKTRWEHSWAGQPQRAYVYLMQGVTSMRNTSGPAKQILPVKHAIDKGQLPGPRIFLGGGLFMSDKFFADYSAGQKTPPDAMDWMRNEFAYAVIADPDKDTERFAGPDFNYWKLYLADKKFDGKNDFTDDQLRFIINKAHKLGKIVDVHCNATNDGMRRVSQFDVNTLEHPFYGHFLVDTDIIEAFVKKGVIVDSLLRVMVVGAEHAADPHRFDETDYVMSMEPSEYKILLSYRDRMLQNKKKPDQPALPIYDSLNPPDAPGVKVQPSSVEGSMTATGRGPSYTELQKQVETSRENMRRFIKAGAKLAMGTDTPSFLNFQQDDPNARELMYMVELGMDPMSAIQAATRNGAEALGLLKELGTIEKGKLADVIVVAGNPLVHMDAMKRVAFVVKGGVRYK